ncbi:MAG: DUF3592 domain-containing protein [Moraxellaceae bacterium]|nr:DUF3592 domain-containing protein [Moraxellaceae bacterium]
MAKSSSRGGRIFLVLFGLPFFGVGVGMLVLALLPTLHDAWQMRTWQPVSARVLSADLLSSYNDGSTSWKAVVEYRYYAGGRERTGTRVAINDSGYDSVGDFQRQRAGELRRAMSNARPITVWVNPDNPDDSVYHRDVRWGMVGFYALFALVFGSVGAALIGWAILHKDKEPLPADAAEPWRLRPEWASPVLRADNKSGVWVLWGFALLWTALSLPVTFAVPSELAKGNQAILIGLLFPLIGVGLVVSAIYASLAARKFGATVLTLDPYPGRIGGQVGGDIVAPVPFQADLAFEVSLSCVRVHETGTGKNRRTSRSPHWQETRHLLGEPTAEGHTRIWFSFATPADLPASEDVSDDYTEWRLTAGAKLPGIDFDREWPLPVFVCADAAQNTAAAGMSAPLGSAPAVAVQSIPAQRMRAHLVHEMAQAEAISGFSLLPTGGAAMDFRAGRRWGTAVMLLLFGAIFAGAGVFLFSLDEIVPRYVMGPVFSLTGGGIFLGGLWSLGNRLRVEADSRSVRIRHWLFGIPVHRVECAPGDVRGLALSKGGTMTTGNKTTVYYGLELVLQDEKRHAIGDGFKGVAQATQAGAAFAQAARLPFLGAQRRPGMAERKAARQGKE